MKKFYIIIVFLIFGKIVAAPTVTVAPLSGVQDVNSTKSVVYFQVNFSEPVAGFTATDVTKYKLKISAISPYLRRYMSQESYDCVPVDYTTPNYTTLSTVAPIETILFPSKSIPTLAFNILLSFVNK